MTSFRIQLTTPRAKDRHLQHEGTFHTQQHLSIRMGFIRFRACDRVRESLLAIALALARSGSRACHSSSLGVTKVCFGSESLAAVSS